MVYSRKAKYYQTKAWGKTDQNDFLNTVIEISTSLSPLQLLQQLQKIEDQMGRIRKEKWGERNIDIDILTYANQQINKSNLIIPHPYLTQRSFVLAPLIELAPDLNLPKLGNINQFIDLEKIGTEIIATF